MPSPKAFLRDVHDFDLDPKKAYTKDHLGPDGRIKITNSDHEKIAVELPTNNLPIIALDDEDEFISTSVPTVEAPVVTVKSKPKSNPAKSKPAVKLAVRPVVVDAKITDIFGDSNSGKNTVEPSSEKSEPDGEAGST